MIGFAWISAAMAIALLAWSPSAALAQTGDQESKQPAGDPAAGKASAARCAQCHGLDGIRQVPGAPHLAGQHAEYILAALAAYRTGQRIGPELQQMIDITESLSPQEMADLAAYYGSLDPFTHTVAKDGSAAQAARNILAWDPLAAGRAAAEPCAACHGEDGNSVMPAVPGTAGQPRNYLLAAIQAYKDGTRKNDEMQSFAEVLSPSETDLVARFYAASPPKRAEAPIEGDPFAGLAPSATCAGCHGLDGNPSSGDTPRLAGLDAAYLAAATRAYKDGSRHHEVMKDAASKLDTIDVQNVSAYYASKDPKPPREPKPLTVREWTERCNRCHGPNGNSTDPRFPILAGQAKDYLENALKLYHGGERANPFMFAMSFSMGESAIENLATFYAGQTAQ